MSRFWMVRAGGGGRLVDEFEEKGCVAANWGGVGEVGATTTADDLKEQLRKGLPNPHPAAVSNIAAMIWKFAREMAPGDKVVTYDPAKREYLLGEISGDYRYSSDIPEHEQVRPVRWIGRAGRDDLSTNAKNTLGGFLTVFEPGEDVLDEIQRAMNGVAPASESESSVAGDDFPGLREDVEERSRESLKDRISMLDPAEMEHLVAALLRAMGFKTRVSQSGPDRGRDVVASPDGLGFQSPSIIAEVKHRPRTAIGSQQIRSFLGALRPSDRGLYVSTGDFSKDARYEAERSAVPVTLINLDDLAKLVVEHYESFDADGRALLPLVRVYWPAG
ncbi:MAG: restriction endonuclease [bacterium]